MADSFTPEPHDFIGGVFDVRTYDLNETIAIGDASLTFAATSHYIPSFALRCAGA